ncbi:MAG: adenylate/guanylate cyclase domain-containing protein, partial [Sphingopyxis sp.]
MGDAFNHYRGGVRWRIPSNVSIDNGVSEVPVFENLPITTFTNPDMMTPDIMPVMAELVRGRHILIGGDIIDNDEFTTPLSLIPDLATGEQRDMIGLEVHAHMLAQILDDAMLIQIPSSVIWITAILAIVAGAVTALLDVRPWVSALLLLAQLALIVLIPFGLQKYGFDTLDLPVAGVAGGWLLAFIAATSALRAVGAEERAFAQSALGKYLPRDIAQEILRDPDRLALHGEKKAIYCLFSDLEGFTTMSHIMSPENVAFVLNAYLDTLSEVILAHGGTIDKFVGDAVVAFWGAPIARADDAQKAAQALIAMTAAGEAFAKRMAGEQGGTLPPIGRTRVGLHYGEAVVGNFGGEGRIQYTALGDSMNTAARLESANKLMKTRAL